MTFKNLLLLPIVAILICSCSTDSENTSSDPSEAISYEWEIVDSLDFEYLGDPILGAVNESANRAVFYNYAESNILISDLEGNLIAEFKKNEDTPDSYGFMLELPGFFDNESITVLGMSGVFIYDLEGNLITKIDHPESIGGAAFMSKVGKTIKTTSFGGKDYILSKSMRSHDSYPGEMKFYEDFKALELIDVESGESTEIVPFPEGSQFLNGMGYFLSDYEPAYTAKGNKLYVVLGGEPILHALTLSESGATYDTLINLNIPDFEEIEGKELSAFSEGSITVTGSTPAIRDIHLVDGKILLPYYAGMNPAKMEEVMGIFESGDQEEAERIFEQYEEEVSRGVLVFDQNSLEYLGEIKMNDKLPSVTFASDGDFLWMQKAASEEVEEDFRRIYKVKIVGK
ncbi:hypothetical protein [Algoriphagus sediminis]|uniref:DUF4221 domain-containing protein n=1 Tax=Algoriphagus sediminis TaxID=3057113 RepID=A0ABT7Y994_9BACT|nr:hypothetical protein [Algoriphagus sediminis]MDN3203082.1 hypothetical protein [Algoriphagus sediminis]